jgi:hypothetical protein
MRAENKLIIRVVVDAALGLQGLGHSVDRYISYDDPQHCFEMVRVY